MTIQSGLCGVYSFCRLHACERLCLYALFYFALFYFHLCHYPPQPETFRFTEQVGMEAAPVIWL